VNYFMPRERKGKFTLPVKRSHDLSPRAEDFAAGKRFGAKSLGAKKNIMEAVALRNSPH
jgi:hypothetical protein